MAETRKAADWPEMRSFLDVLRCTRIEDSSEIEGNIDLIVGAHKDELLLKVVLYRDEKRRRILLVELFLQQPDTGKRIRHEQEYAIIDVLSSGECGRVAGF